MSKPQDHDELRAALREAAGRHEPDRARILARVERGTAGDGEHRHRPVGGAPVLGWARVVGATAAVAGVLAVGGYAVASAVRDDSPPQQTVAVSPSPEPSPDATSRAPAPPDPSPSTGAPERSGTPSAPASGTPEGSASPPASSHPPAADAEDGPLWSDGSVDPHSNDFWAQSNVTVKNDRALTALTVRLRIAQTGGVTSTGAWRSLPEDDFTLTVGERDGYLIYIWVLKDGRTVPAGAWVFAGQYDHERGGRDAKDDGYTATARTPDGTLSVAGGFARTSDDDGDS
ncbi:hypothetical protein ACFV6E_16300 [Streptomyces sp. NPDC059785]|uniref:hypothetical protein n=1 Tax=unclassified Streptomyces TaxID=2593676 RepID=UPI00365ED7A6